MNRGLFFDVFDFLCKTEENQRNNFFNNQNNHFYEFSNRRWNLPVPRPVIVVNSAPVGIEHTATTTENLAVDINLTATDADSDSLTYSVVQPALHGTVNIVGSVATYTPQDYWNGTDTFEYEAYDGTDYSAHKLVTVNVASVNHSPVSSDQVASTIEGVPVTITLPSHDPDPEDTLTYSIVSSSSNGTLSDIFSYDRITYTPTGTFHGVDTFTFKVYDGVVYSNIATVTVNVTGTNDAPYTNDGLTTTDEDTAKEITFSGGDADGDTLTYLIDMMPSHGTLSAVDGNKVTYTPDLNYNGHDHFLFKANDGHVDSNISTESITINPVNDPPSIVPVHDVTIDELIPYSLLITAVDPESPPQTITYSIESAPTGANINSSTGEFSWTPTEAQGPGDYPIILKVNDGAASSTTNFSIHVNEVNIAPVASDNELDTDTNVPIEFTLNATDTDNGTTLSYIINRDPFHGTVNILSGNNVRYTPATDYVGTDTFEFKAYDGTAYSNIGTVSIDVGVEEAEAVPEPVRHGAPNHSVVLPQVHPLDISGNLDFTINDGSGKTSSPNLEINMNAHPDTVNRYKISIDPDFQAAEIFPYVTPGKFILPDKAGTYTIYLKYISQNGIESPVISHTIIYEPATIQKTATTTLITSTTTTNENVTREIQNAPTKNFVFTRGLNIFSLGDDVRELQKFLNTHGFVIAQSGVGSPGNETTVFGPLTADALVKFQEAHASDILVPQGLTKGTGNFYAWSRKLINNILSSGQ